MKTGVSLWLLAVIFLMVVVEDVDGRSTGGPGLCGHLSTLGQDTCKGLLIWMVVWAGLLFVGFFAYIFGACFCGCGEQGIFDMLALVCCCACPCFIPCLYRYYRNMYYHRYIGIVNIGITGPGRNQILKEEVPQ